MISINKIYISKIAFFIYTKKKKGEYKIYHSYQFSLEDAIDWMRDILNSEFYELYDRDQLNEKELYEFTSKYIKDFHMYTHIVSGNRKLFETTDELLQYFKENICNVSNNNLYDFLLSLSYCQSLDIDINGNIISSGIEPQHPYGERIIKVNVDFTEESCKEGKYQFIYNNKGADNLHNLLMDN